MDEALKDPQIPEAEKSKIRLAQQAKQFAESDLGLTASKNYTDYVPLKRSSVVYAVNAAEKWKLKSYLWDFPFVGTVPYKGYFAEADARSEAQSMSDKGYDTYVRGVSAYSTLGYFRDSLLSSMTKASDHNLVNTIIHETTHATLYIESNADFNERLAVFVGNLGTEKFYQMKEGPNSKTLLLIKSENQDEALFAKFIAREIELLDLWYKDLEASKDSAEKKEDQRKQRLRLVQEHFLTELKPQLKSDLYSSFDKISLNNARLMLYKTYLSDLSDFENLYKLCQQNLGIFLAQCKSLEKSKTPEQDLKKIKTCLL
jgi:predicted aminopeptidase